MREIYKAIHDKYKIFFTVFLFLYIEQREPIV